MNATKVKRKRLRKPPPLRSGDRVGVVAPASPCPPQEIEAGCSVLEKLGLEVTVNVGLEDFHPRYLAGSDSERAHRFNEFIRDPDIKAMFSARGGYGSLRLLAKILYEDLWAAPKALVGFSDITALLLACHQQAGVVCFHGPTVSSLATADPETVQALWIALSDAEPLRFQFPEALCLGAGSAQGPVLGGNLTTFCHLLGTPFMPDFTDCIVFLEDRGEAMYRIDRMLTQLMHAGILEGIAGLLLGDFSESGPRHELEDVVQERLASAAIPILSGIPIGHQQRNLTLPLGLSATLNADNGTLIYHQAATE